MKWLSTLLLAMTMGLMMFMQNVNAQTTKTIGPGANYSTLKLAFDAINAGTITGAITFQIIASTTETASAVLNASGSGSANYTSVTIYPTLPGKTISGNLAAPLINFNGADNVTIDGRVNQSGTTNLIISNTSNSAIAGTSTIRFINDATNNFVKYCTIKGSSTNAVAGILFFSSTTGTTGNDGNTIDNNNITNSADVKRPLNAIYSAGTAGHENSENIISDNNICDFLNRGTASNGINLAGNTTAWTISGNSFYETTSFVATASVAYIVLNINNSTGINFTVNGNYIGGTAAQCGSAAWTKSSLNTAFTAINLKVGTGTASSVQNNIIQNIAWSNSGSAAWMGIDIEAGNVNVGSTTGNLVGSTTGTGSITVTGGATATNVYGINIASTGTVDCQNNNIGSITTDNVSTLASNFYGINKTAVAGNITISNNTIGSTTTANSISASSGSTSNAQSVYGIFNAGTGTILISGNTIANLNNGTSNTGVATTGRVNGIASVSGTNTISDNTIRDLTIANANTTIEMTGTSSVCGIALTGATLKTLTGNTIYNLFNTYSSFTGYIIGLDFTGGSGANVVSSNIIYNLSVTGSNATAAKIIGLNFNAGTGANSVSCNFIHSFSVNSSSTTASLYGIKIYAGVATHSNNIISLGGNTATAIFGIYDRGAASQTCNLYFNTVYIGGSLASGAASKSYCLYSTAASNTRNFRNNIFMNARSTTGGSSLHYAAWFNYSVNTSLTLGYNDYYAPGTGGVLGYYNAGNKTSLPIVTGLDVNSLTIYPVFAAAGGTSALNYYASASLPGISGTGITTDYSGLTRGATPKMGALEANGYIWQGDASTDFATPSNWTIGAVPIDGDDIAFAASPINDCFLDQNRTIGNISNAQSTYKLVVNGKQLTINKNLNFTNSAKIDATAASSVVVFAGSSAQSIPSGAFLNNTLYALNINNSNGLTLNGDLTVQQALTLTSGAFSIGANTLTINGAISTTAGTLTGGSSTNISIGGSSATTTLPSVSLNNLTLNRASGISLGGAVNISGILLLTAGTLNTGGNLTLLSTASQTALIDGSGAGQINGNVTLQRYISSAFGYKYVSSPFQSATVAQFATYIDLTAAFPNFYRYDENQLSNEWIDYSIPANLLVPTQAYAANFGTSKTPLTISFSGVVNNGTQTTPTLYNHNNPFTLGFNLVGNPYPSPVDWNASSGWTRTNIDNAVYYFDASDTYQYYGTYSSYINGISSNGIANNIIPSMQGFFIHVSNGTYPVAATLVFNNGVRINNLTPVFHKSLEAETRPFLRLSAGFGEKGSRQDAVVVYFEDSASPAFDKEFDALKMMNTDDLYPNLYAFSSDLQRLSINAIPSLHDSITLIPLGLRTANDGLITFNARDIELIPGGTHIYLQDRQAGMYHDLRINPKFNVYLPAGDYEDRFALILSLKGLKDSPHSNDEFYVYSSGGKLFINLNLTSGTGGDILVYDLMGRNLLQKKFSGNGRHEMEPNLDSGIYIVSFLSNTGLHSKKVFISNL